MGQLNPWTTLVHSENRSTWRQTDRSFYSSMLPLVSKINSWLLSINHALIRLTRQSYEWQFSHRFHQLTTLIIHHPRHSFMSGLKPFLLQMLPTVAFLFFYGFPGLFTDTSELIRFYFISSSFFRILVFGSVRLIKLTCVSFWAHVKIASRIVSYRIVSVSSLTSIQVKLKIHLFRQS